MQELLNTLSKYPRFLIGITLGIFFNLMAPIKPLLQNPITAIAFVGSLVGGFLCITFVLKGMLGLT